MCGVSGVLSRNLDALEEGVVTAMRDALVHRGPDGAGLWCDRERGIALGHRRLAIQDLSPAGEQPMHSVCGRYVLCFNGEIYNHLDLRKALKCVSWRGHCDAETLVELIAAWGLERALEPCVGMWAFALWDRARNCLTLARDRAGEKPLYYGWQGGVFLFASEPKAIATHPGCSRQVDRQAIAALMRYKVIPAPLSIYKGVNKVLPGHYVQVSLARPAPRVTTYWDPVARAAAASHRGATAPPDVDTLEALLLEAARGQMISDVPLGAFLSGGIDSSLIVALMQEVSERPVKTFTIGSDVTEFDESMHAQAVAKHLGTEHTHLQVTDRQAREEIPSLPSVWSEPFADSSQIPTLLVSRLARESVTVALSGDGADELFGGYNRHVVAARQWSRLARLPASFRASAGGAIRLLSPSAWSRLGALIPGGPGLSVFGERLHKAANVMDATSIAELHRRLLSHWAHSDDAMFGADEPLTVFDRAADAVTGERPIHGMMLIDFMGYLPDDILAKVDRASMAVSLETRAPYLDHRVIEFAWSCPEEMLFRDGQGKWPLRELLYRRVPRQLMERPKMGFGVPVARWLRGPLREWAESLLSEERLDRDGLFNPLPIRKAWQAHLGGRVNEAYRLWDVLMVNAWIDAQGASL